MQIHCGDCLPFMRSMPDACVDLLLTDPPYFRVKAEAWDRQWSDADAFIAWIGELCQEWRRILKPTGTLFVFASPQMRARVELEVARHFQVLPTITWAKPQGRHMGCCKEDLRSFFPQTEAIVFAEPFGSKNRHQRKIGESCEPVRLYLVEEWTRAGLTARDANAATGTSMAGHWFGRSQWALPSAENYARLQAFAAKNGRQALQRDHASLRAEVEQLRPVLARSHGDLSAEAERSRRPFALSKASPHHTDVWTFPPVQPYPGKHPCEKPAAMMEFMISTASRPGDLVFDPFMGSGAVGVAAAKLGRQFIGCDLDRHWCDYAGKRLAPPAACA
ncbi:MAG: hypothetical protein RL095_2165 [Verrucomicrobiota bacterium]|jgi:site-specific DNA-methyltransferase (adenine-specific)